MSAIRTKSDYQQYVHRVEAFFKFFGVSSLSVCLNDNREHEEPYFSRLSCPCCKTTLGGMRYHCCAYSSKDKEVLDFGGICTDCVYYSEYGRLDDMTMVVIEKNAE